MSSNEQVESTHGGDPSGQQASVSIQQMFDCNRIDSYRDIFFLCLYFPFGICLFTVRLFIFIQVLLVSSIFPKESFLRSVIFRSIFMVLGLVIQEGDLNLKNFKAQLIISNWVSDFDPLVINLIYPCAFLSSGAFPRYITWLFGVPKEEIAQNKNDKAMIIKNSSLPCLCFPESSRTNGRIGLFKFENWPFSCDFTSHLIFVEGKNPLFNASISPLGASWMANLFWLFFLPFTVFNIRYLSSVNKNENESIDDFAKRTQILMASQTNLYASNFDKSDKKEMMKRMHAEQMAMRTQKSKEHTPQRSSALSVDIMAVKVKEVLPQVPLAAIKTDIAITKNIDDTIERILNGSVPYTPEAAPAKDSPKAESSAAASPSSSESGKLFYCGASTFGKSTNERAKSFQERKEHLFRVARMRYIQKHNLGIQQQ